MNERVRVIGSELLSDNWGRLSKVTFELMRRDGQWQRQIRECYDRGHAAVILMVDPQRNTVILTRQFRYPVFANGDPAWLIEACAGLLDGDDPATCAMKEAHEETGYVPTAIKHVFDSYMSPGSVQEKLSFFVGTYDAAARKAEGGGLIDEGEDIEVLEMGLDAALAMIDSGEIVDAKTIMLLQHVALRGV